MMTKESINRSYETILTEGIRFERPVLLVEEKTDPGRGCG
jgi:hypothetical protein